MDDDAIDFVAHLLHQQDCLKQGYTAGTRWWCTREDIKAEYRAKARATIAEWAAGERRIQAEMDAIKTYTRGPS